MDFKTKIDKFIAILIWEIQGWQIAKQAEMQFLVQDIWLNRSLKIFCFFWLSITTHLKNINILSSVNLLKQISSFFNNR